MANTILGKVIGRRHYGWVIFCLVFCNMIVEGGMRNSAPVTFLALRNGFGRSAGATAAIFSTVGLTSIIFSPLLGVCWTGWARASCFPWATAHPTGIPAQQRPPPTSGNCSFFTESWPLSARRSFRPLQPRQPWRRGSHDPGDGHWASPMRVIRWGKPFLLPLSQALIVGIGWRGAFRVIGPAFFLLVAPANYLLQRPASSGQGPPRPE